MLNKLGIILGKLAASPVELHPAKTCPECGSQLARETNATGTEADWHCPNPDCPPQVLKRVVLWASPEAMDIQGCDAALVLQLVNRGLVRDGAEFYRLRVAEIAALEGMTKDRAQQLFDSITASMKREAWRVLVGLGVPHIGPAEAKSLCQHFATLDDVFAAGNGRLVSQVGISEGAARSLVHWYGDPVNRRLVDRLRKLEVNFKSDPHRSPSAK